MYIADLHIHSRYSRATSKEGTPEMLDFWARRKGIHLVGTGDFTHPAWRAELEEKLVPAEEGLWKLKDSLVLPQKTADARTPRFVISGEISSIYRKNGKVRKVHSLILLPGLEDASRLSARLETIGNIHSDGRPILGLDCRDLLEITMDLCPRAIYIPAHIWTPHFSLFGACSGFDTIEACFEDMTPWIHALETGLSSDPPMNWRLSALDGYQLVSNSDAHSPSKLGREATLLDTELSYSGLKTALEQGIGLKGTIEFFPEEGKYHFDGHRKCHICFSPEQAREHQDRCPVCGKKLTMGVAHRVDQLADRQPGFVPLGAKPFESLAPLPEVIGASTGHGVSSKAVEKIYQDMTEHLGPEFAILREIPIEQISRQAGQHIAQGIERLRRGQVERIPGFDGAYGVVRLFQPWELEGVEGQLNLFDALDPQVFPQNKDRNSREEKAQIQGERLKEQERAISEETEGKAPSGKEPSQTLNQEQRRAVESVFPRIAVEAGPGTGKTRTLVARILHLLQIRRIPGGEITAVTFTNQAARELRQRLEKSLGGKSGARRIHTGTFHSICYDILKKRQEEFWLADRSALEEIAGEIGQALGDRHSPAALLSLISRKKTGLALEERQEELAARALELYQARMDEWKAWDFDDLLLKMRDLVREGGLKESEKKAFSYLLVDEFQDISPLQYELIQGWSSLGKELFVIGDPDQAIYGFRGASARCFQQLQEEGQTLVIRLKENYRSVPEILQAAGRLIAPHNPERWLRPVRDHGLTPRKVQAGSELSEAIFTAKEISRMVGGMDMLEVQDGEERVTRTFGDIGILYRTHRQARLLEKCLQKEGIPYVVTGRESFLEEAPVRGTLEFFRSLREEQNQLARLTCQKLLWAGRQDSQIAYQRLAERYQAPAAKARPEKLLADWKKEMNLEGDPAMEKLSCMAVFYRTMDEFLRELSFGRESDLRRSSGKDYQADAVTLMTLHGSKGLEFPVVFLLGCCKGLIPLEQKGRIGDVQEERRLFYVGMTRAKEELILSWRPDPSPFLEELGDLVREEDAQKRARQSQAPKQMSIFDFIGKD